MTPQADQVNQVEQDYQIYKCLLDLWSRENPIKTTKLQVLLAVNAVLISAVNISGGITAGRWYMYLAGAIFCAIWTFSIGRTSLFQDVWQIKMAQLQQRYRDDPRFGILDTGREQRLARPLLRTLGAIPSKWYLLFAPLGFAIGWLVILAVALAS